MEGIRKEWKGKIHSVKTITSQHQKHADCSRGLFRDTEMERRKDKTSLVVLLGIIEP